MKKTANFLLFSESGTTTDFWEWNLPTWTPPTTLFSGREKNQEMPHVTFWCWTFFTLETFSFMLSIPFKRNFFLSMGDLHWIVLSQVTASYYKAELQMAGRIFFPLWIQEGHTKSEIAFNLPICVSNIFWLNFVRRSSNLNGKILMV